MTGMTQPDTSYILRGTPRFRATVLALLAAGFSTFAVLYCTQPLLPLLARDFGVSAAVSSLSLSVATGTLAPAMLIAGPLSDALGRRVLLLTALFICAFLTILSGFLPDWNSLLVIRALQGVVLSGVTAVAMAYVAEEMDKARSAWRWGCISAAMPWAECPAGCSPAFWRTWCPGDFR